MVQRSGAANALGDGDGPEKGSCRDRVGYDREEETREEPTHRIVNIPRGESAKELASHLPPYEPCRNWCASCVGPRCQQSTQV